MEKSPTVFLIDDDSDDQEIFSTAMYDADKKIKCVFADDGLAAIEKIKAEESFKPDFIFIDINMPRMNGIQCLTEIKKIKRLSHVPVFMYSTSADPVLVEENKRLGAADFIIKPSSIKDLTKILSKIVRQKVLSVMCLLFCLNITMNKVYGQTDTLRLQELKKLSMEELMDIEVTSVSKSPEKLTEVASAVQVITGEDIERSTATRLPEALRLATNMQVAQAGSHDWGITARGFNGAPVSSSSLADKLLVMIDGRAVYTPLFGGVFWDVQNVLLEDVDRIEVVSGPGGTLWGANAVNGIINVISKSAKETQGLFVKGEGGSMLRDFGAVRFGGHIDTTAYYRVYGQRFDYNSTNFSGDVNAHDSWNLTQGGFRMDYSSSAKNTFTFQGDLYTGEEDDTASTIVNGQNIIGRWTRSFSEKSGLIVQSYFDRTYRNIKRQGFIDELKTYDIDVQHSLSFNKRNLFLYGLEYRLSDDKINSVSNNFKPTNRTVHLLSAFAQDQIKVVPEFVELTLGIKFLYNDYTKMEFHPSAHIAWTPSEIHTIWAAVSRAVRIPTRFDVDYVGPDLGSFGDFKSEKVNAFELGYRFLPMEKLFLSLATFYNQYKDLRSIDINNTPPPVYYFANNMKANSYGVELSANFIATSWWKLRGGYTYLKESFKYTSLNTFPKSNLLEAIDPENQYLIQSVMNIAKHLQVDFIVRYTDALPTTIDGSVVPAYTSFDVKIGWQKKWLTVAVSGQNLTQKYHVEFGNKEIPQKLSGSLTIRF